MVEARKTGSMTCKHSITYKKYSIRRGTGYSKSRK